MNHLLTLSSKPSSCKRLELSHLTSQVTDRAFCDLEMFLNEVDNHNGV